MRAGDYILCEGCGHYRKVTPELVEASRRAGVRAVNRSRGLFICEKCGDRRPVLITRREYDELFRMYRSQRARVPHWKGC
jgi:hypothetical protein